MKRWQDRGEVEDSEGDDDLSLDADSPSPERPHKRAKHVLDKSGEEADSSLPAPADHNNISDGEDEDEDESHWIQAKVATTYGRRGRVAKQISAPISRHQTPRRDALSGSTLGTGGRETSKEIRYQSPSRIATSRNNTDDPQTDPAISTQLEVAGADHSSSADVPAAVQDNRITQNATQAHGNLDLTSALSSARHVVQPQLSASVLLKRPVRQDVYMEGGHAAEEQPGPIDPSTLLTTPGHSHQTSPEPALSGSRNDNFTRLADLSSSPLSEREVSPPPMFMPEKTNVTSPLDNDLETLSDTESLPRDFDSLGAQSRTSAADARRSLRARKEKQLHPYMYDKAQYQKQFRERGLKPVRVLENATPNEETQSASQSAGSQSSEATHVLSSSPVSQPLLPPNTAPLQLDYFDAASGSSEDELGLDHRLTKRRRIDPTGQARPGRLSAQFSVSRPIGPSPVLDEFSIPMSPPRTSSDTGTPNVTARHSRPVVSGFRLPLGRIPLAPPTPQISSDVRPQNIDMISSGGPSAGTSRDHRGRSDTLSPGLSSSESEAEEEARAEAEAKRLRREQKRIKGVLPASWLRIDFQKQQVRRSPSPIGRRFSVEPSPGAEPQKGVARKITTARPRQDAVPGLHALGGGESDDSDVSVQELIALPKQSRLVFEDNQVPLNHMETAIDDEEMENDFVDPMLAGMSRSVRTNKNGPNQPRITHAFRKTSGMRKNLTEDRLPSKRDANGVGFAASETRKRRRQAHQRSSATRLSIVDAPKSPLYAGKTLPQFVRLALRRVRREPTRGRHSPTDKILRLATVDETEEASSVLRAWRDGTIAPRRSQSPTRFHDQPRSSARTVGGHRVPLTNLPANGYQSRLGATESGKSAASAARPRQRLRQTQIEPSARGERAGEQGPFEQAHQATRKRQTAQVPLQRTRLRHGQLETLESEFDQLHRSVAFERRMQFLTENIALPERRSRTSGFPLARFLGTDDAGTTNGYVPSNATQAAEPGTAVLTHRPRKAFARHLDTGSRQYRQPSEPLPDGTVNDEVMHIAVSPSVPVLEGLGPFGTRYSIDFDVEPLGLGTFFQHTTFIGSGDFGDALNLGKRDLHRAGGHMRVQLDGEMLEWGGWNEDVAANFKRIPQAISEALQTLELTDTSYDREQQLSAVDSNIDYLLRSVVRFCSKCLYFVDTIDRISCVDSLHRLVIDLADIFTESAVMAHPLPQTMAKVLQYELVITKQASQLGDYHTVPPATRKRIDGLLSCTSRRLIQCVVIGRLDELRSFYDVNRRALDREAGVDGNAYALSSIVMLNKTTHANQSKSLLWPAIDSIMGTEIGKACVVGDFEKLWYDLFTLLPALELTATGTLCLGSRLVRPQENWSLPQAMLSRVLELYERSSDVRGYSVNDYVRALLSRCYTLVEKWGWWRCEPVLNVIYDFFSRRGLALLKREDSRGSPKFLDQLGSGLVELEVQNDDRSFHIFLKILASGLVGMSKHQLYEGRKIQGIAWRFIPNHNRSYRKDVDLERSTLDALRNHHDLICTLYYASPPGHRPGVHLLRELVDHSTSHREACRLNVRSWANVASFQASTTETLEVLSSLTGWFASIMRTTIAQYRLARSEAQQAFEQAKTDGANPSEALLESTVTNNQRQIAATLVDALAGLKRALGSASNSAVAVFLVQETTFWTVFELFDPSQRRLLSAMTEALHVVGIAMNVEQRPTSTPESQHGSDDSQDFGDSDALQEFAANEKNSPDKTSMADLLLGPIGQFMSNVLGADIAPDDHLLQKTIDAWVLLASSTVKNGRKSWISYVDDYSSTGWGQLRDTVQRRKFTTYFMSRVVEQPTLDVEIGQHVMNAWLLSLVEREALLKFQHSLTSALLNHFSRHRLLQNLPFAKDSKGEFHVTLSELRQRRLALLSSILCNMREAYDEATAGAAQEIRNTFGEMLRQMMQTMKRNYQELQSGRANEVANSSVQGAYVGFVQQLVSLLQQHTTSICRVDGFFTDSNVFPLPADDPTYVVGRLKGYVPKLRKPQSRKELAAFIQSVSERAAVDGQQPYLVNQLSTAMKGVMEQGDRTSPSLRYLLLTTMFPAYIENSFATACSWILVLPILQACEQVLPDLLYSVKIEDESSAMAATESAIAVIHVINHQLENILGGFPGMLAMPHILRTLSAMLRVGTSCLTLASLLKRATSHSDQLMQQLWALRELGIEAGGRLEGSNEAHMFEASTVASTPITPWPDTKLYAEAQLRNDMNMYWHADGGRSYLRRHNKTQEAVVSLQNSEEERRRLLQSVASYRGAYDAIFRVGGRKRRCDASDDRLMGNVVV